MPRNPCLWPEQVVVPGAAEIVGALVAKVASVATEVVKVAGVVVVSG